jgi:TRAP-type mannitol/chloroaromatic compound transport system substrate-binding protein
MTTATDSGTRETEAVDLVETAPVARRGVLAAAVAGAGVVAAPAVLRAQAAITWRMATAWPKNTPGVGVNAQRLADMIGAMSGGRLRVQLFAAGELVPPFEVFDAVASGAVDCGHATPYYWQGKEKSFHYFTGVPFGLTATEHAGWLRFGGAQALWEKAYAPFGVVPFYAGSSGPQAGGWFRKEINTADDLKGLKMRIAGLGAEVLRKLGATPVLTPPGEIFQAMQSGLVDAVEWVGPWNDLAFGLFRVAKFYYLPAFHEFGPALELIVNKRLYDALPNDLKEIVTRAAQASSYEALADFTFHNIESYRPLLAREGVQVKALPDALVQLLAKESEVVLAEIGASSPIAKEVHESFVTYRRKSAEYALVMDGAVHAMRRMALGL